MDEGAACPVCADQRLDEAGRCGACGGSLIHDAVEVLASVGIERALLTQLLEETGSLGHRCPGCGYQMTRAPVRGEMIDLCQGCGAMWVDASELARIQGVELERRPLPAAEPVRSMLRKLESGRVHASPAKYLGIGLGYLAPMTALLLVRGGAALAPLLIFAGAFGFGWMVDVPLKVDADLGLVRYRRGKRWHELDADDVTGVQVGPRRWLRYPIWLTTESGIYPVYYAATARGGEEVAHRLAGWLGMSSTVVQIP